MFKNPWRGFKYPLKLICQHYTIAHLSSCLLGYRMATELNVGDELNALNKLGIIVWNLNICTKEILLARLVDEDWAGGRQLRPPEWRRLDGPTISKILQILPGCEQKSSWFTFLIQAASLLASVRSSGSRVAVSLFKFSVFPAPVSFHSLWITITVSMQLGTMK